MDDKRKYNYMENVLQNINRSYISLPEDEVRRNNQVLENVLQQIIKKMKEKNALFKQSYERVFYGGSYYDGLRVGNPEEFDLDLLLTLPKYAKPVLSNSNMPGFVHLQLEDYGKWQKQPESHLWKGLESLLDDKHYLVTSKVSAWIEGVVKKALNEFPQRDNDTIFTTNNGEFKGRIHKGGPAHTLKLSGRVNGKPVVMDVDLVPCFVFGNDMWPKSPYRSNPVSNKPGFFIVPKKPGGDGNVDRYWRLSFQEQERELINGSRTLKPTVKLLKKMRDNLDHKSVASYFIKTVFLWELENKSLWEGSLSYVFMFMLKKYKQYLDSKKIPYFWNKNNNLVGKVNDITLQNFTNKLQRIIDDIEKHPEDPYVVAKYLVQDDQLEKLKSETVIGKKQMKKLQQLSISNTTNGTNPSATLITHTQSNNSSQVDSVYFQNKIDIHKMITGIVEDYFKQTSTIKISSLVNCKEEVQADEQFNQNLNNITAACSATSNSDNITDNKTNKLQESLDRLTLAIESLQRDNTKVFNLMENLLMKIDEINVNIQELKQVNCMFRNRLVDLEEKI